MQLMPAGLPVTLDFFKKLSSSHGLLPIRIEYPLPGDAWEKRLVIYDNAQPNGGVGFESYIEFTRNGDTLDFVIEHSGDGDPDARQQEQRQRMDVEPSVARGMLADERVDADQRCVPALRSEIADRGRSRAQVRRHRAAGVRRPAGRGSWHRRREPLPPAARPGPDVHDQRLGTRRTRRTRRRRRTRSASSPADSDARSSSATCRWDVRRETSCASPTVCARSPSSPTTPTSR